MSTRNRLAELSHLGLRLWREGDKLRCAAPPGVLTQELTAELKRRKDEILDLLATGAETDQKALAGAIPQAPEGGEHALSPQQRRFVADFGWSEQESWSTVVLQSPFPLPACQDATSEAFRAVCLRHDCMRLSFPKRGENRVQLIKNEPGCTFTHEQLNGMGRDGLIQRANAICAQASELRWQVESGPLGHFYFLCDSESKVAQVVFLYHRVLMDGASVKLMLGDFTRTLRALQTGNGELSEPPPSPRYRDFSNWLNALEDRDAFASSRDYWRGELQPPLPDPFGFNAQARTGTPGTQAGLAVRLVSQEVAQRARAYCASRGWLFPMMMFAVYVAALWDADGGEEFVIDGSLSGRVRPELHSMLGFLTNAAGIRVSLNPQQPLATLVDLLTQKFSKAEEHQFFQYDAVVDDLGVCRQENLFPLSGILFNTITFDRPVAEVSPGRAGWQPVATQTRYALMYYVMCHPDGLSLELKHRLSLVDRARAERIVDRCQDIIAQLAEGSCDRAIAQLCGRHT